MGDMTRGALIFTAAAGVTGVGVGVLAQHTAPTREDGKPAPLLIAGHVEGDVPLDADAEAWRATDPLTATLKPQQLVAPMLEQATVDDVELRALVGARELAVLVRFTAHSPEDLPGLAAYGDAVALQLPLVASGPRPAIAMGGPGQPVHIIRWSSIWQRDVDRGRSRVETIYPNTVRDVSPESVLPPRTARLYSPGRAVGNPMSATVRRTPVEEAFAEGFGTLTPLPDQRARGQGRHANNHWNVVIAAPLDRRPSGDALADQVTVPVAIALWIGADDNRGSRKHFSDWVECAL